jgi:mono/diheme cytochrome c family protein
MLLWTALLGCPSEPAPTGSTSPEDLCVPVDATFARQCVGCHGADGAAGLDLRDLSSLVEKPAEGAFLPLVAADGDLQQSYLWHKIAGTQGRVGGGGATMPPVGGLDADGLAAVEAWIGAGGQCVPGDLPVRPPDPGEPQPIPIRRMNRFELDRAVRDLLGSSLRPSEGLPADDTLAGFDTLGEALTVSDVHVEQLEHTLEAVAEDFVARTWPGGPVEVVVDPTTMSASTGAPLGDAWMLWANGTLAETIEVPVAGDYHLEVRAWGDQAGTAPVRMAVLVDGPIVATLDVPNAQPALSYLVDLSLEAGSHDVSVAFLNDLDGPEGDRNLVVAGLRVWLDTPDDPVYAAFADGLTCDPEVDGRKVCLEALLGPLQSRAYRRPVPPDERARLVDGLDAMATTWDLPYPDTVTAGVHAVLLSPHFLFRPEIGTPDGRLTDHELATRLATFLWSSLPDDELRDLADAGRLVDDAVLEEQVRRMLADPRADALVESFGGQWLWLRRIGDATPDPTVDPVLHEERVASFREQARRLVHDALLGDRPLHSVLTRTDPAIDPILASFYGFGGQVNSWTEVDLSSTGRVGLLGNAGLLASLSNPTTSNPVRRGKWMMSQLLCDEPGDPPPAAVADFDPTVGEGTLRERFAVHRSDPVCASCHQVMDPLGFSLEAFGPAGEARDVDDLGYPVDTTGTLPDGRTFDGPGGLATLLADDPAFTLCAAEKAFTYGLGTRVDAQNHPFVREAHERFVSGGGHFDDLVVGIVLGDAFRRRTP